MPQLTLEVSQVALDELELLLAEHRKHEEVPIFDSVEAMVRSFVGVIVEGSTGPGTWERQLLYPLGLIPLGSEVLKHYRAPGSAEANDPPGYYD